MNPNTFKVRIQKTSMSPSNRLKTDTTSTILNSRRSRDVLKMIGSPKNSTEVDIQFSNIKRQLLSKTNSSFSSFIQMNTFNEPQQESVLVVVSTNGTEIRFNFKGSMTTTQLRSYLVGKLKYQPRIIQFVTIDHEYMIDYYLSLDHLQIHALAPKIQVQPLIFEPQEQELLTLTNFQIIKCIGTGGFSRVYLVRLKSTGKFYAMKLIDKEFIMQNKKQELVQNEKDIMAITKHPFVIKMHYAFESRNYVIFIMDFCSGGELFYQLKAVKRMTEDQALFYFTEICLAMLYLHQVGIIYRDVKPENILVDIDGHIRIADFGLSKIQSSDEFAYSFCGSPEYMAPEMLLKNGHNYQVDHYCLGALLYELVTGLPPFYSRSTQKIYDSILNEQVSFPQNLSNEIVHLMTGLLNKVPSKRLGYKGGIMAILQHPWFQKIDFTDILKRKIQPPIKPALSLNFDTRTLHQVDMETRDKLNGKSGLKKDIKLFHDLYYDCNQNQNPDIDRQLAEHYDSVKNVNQKKSQSQDKIRIEDPKISKIKMRIDQQSSLRNSPTYKQYPQTDTVILTDKIIETTPTSRTILRKR